VRNLPYPHSSYNQSSRQPGVASATMTKTIPFDYVFQFDLKGAPGNKVQDVVEISMQGVFVAVSIGYSFVKTGIPRTFTPVIDQTTSPQSPIFVPFSYTSFDSNTFLDGMLVAGMPGADVTILMLTNGPSIERAVKVSENGDGSITCGFNSAMGPLGSGKTDLISLGGDGTIIVNFDPVVLPGSFIRVWDRTNNILSQLFVFGTTPLIGPTPSTRKVPAAGDMEISVYGLPGTTVDVLLLESVTGNAILLGSQLTLNLDATFTTNAVSRETGTKRVGLQKPLAPGDVLLVRNSAPGPTDVSFSMFAVPRPRLSTITLGALMTGLEKTGADLSCGFRLNPNSASLFLADFPLEKLSAGTLDRVFETCCLDAEDVSFLYSIDIVSTGRELQNEAIHNIAGLGISNGDRPFRPLAKPIAFSPRSSIRIQIEERSGPPGELFIVLQGYKMLGTGRTPE